MQKWPSLSLNVHGMKTIRSVRQVASQRLTDNDNRGNNG